MSKTHWKQLINPDYLGAYSLDEGKDLNVTIESVSKEVVTGAGGKKDECSVARIKGQKPFILNSTNSKTIARLCNSPYIEDWANLTITLFVSTTNLKGEQVECLRVRPALPKSKEELTPGSPKWNDAKKAIIEGKVTIETIEKHYLISNLHIKQLLA